MPPTRLAVLLSGTGRSLQNLIDRCADGNLAARVVLVMGDRPSAKGLARAAAAGIPSIFLSPSAHPDVGSLSDAVFDHCRAAEIDLVCLAGFLRLLRIPDDFTNRVLNIHPSLLPLFGGRGMYGRRVHQAVLESGAAESGCTVHFADNEYDTGPIILQRRVPVLPGDTADRLAERVFAAECGAYPEAIRTAAAGPRP